MNAINYQRNREMPRQECIILEPLQHQFHQLQQELMHTRNQLSEESSRAASESRKASELEKEVSA